jgi:hypothetical protein
MSENHAKPKSVSPAASPLAARYFLLRAQEKVPKEKGAPRLGRYAAPLRSSKRALREAEEGPVAQRWDPTLGGAQGLARFGAPISPAGGRIPSSRWGPCSAPRARPRNSTFALRATGFEPCSLVSRLFCGLGNLEKASGESLTRQSSLALSRAGSTAAKGLKDAALYAVHGRDVGLV